MSLRRRAASGLHLPMRIRERRGGPNIRRSYWFSAPGTDLIASEQRRFRQQSAHRSRLGQGCRALRHLYRPLPSRCWRSGQKVLIALSLQSLRRQCSAPIHGQNVLTFRRSQRLSPAVLGDLPPIYGIRRPIPPLASRFADAHCVAADSTLTIQPDKHDGNDGKKQSGAGC